MLTSFLLKRVNSHLNDQWKFDMFVLLETSGQIQLDISIYKFEILKKNGKFFQLLFILCGSFKFNLVCLFTYNSYDPRSASYSVLEGRLVVGLVLQVACLCHFLELFAKNQSQNRMVNKIIFK